MSAPKCDYYSHFSFIKSIASALKIMSKAKERKVESTPSTNVICIIHAAGIVHGKFIPFSTIKGSVTDKLA